MASALVLALAVADLALSIEHRLRLIMLSEHMTMGEKPTSVR